MEVGTEVDEGLLLAAVVDVESVLLTAVVELGAEVDEGVLVATAEVDAEAAAAVDEGELLVSIEEEEEAAADESLMVVGEEEPEGGELADTGGARDNEPLGDDESELTGGLAKVAKVVAAAAIAICDAGSSGAGPSLLLPAGTLMA